MRSSAGLLKAAKPATLSASCMKVVRSEAIATGTSLPPTIAVVRKSTGPCTVRWILMVTTAGRQLLGQLRDPADGGATSVSVRVYMVMHLPFHM